MGFTLVEIKKILQQKDFNIFASLKMQESALTEQIQRIQKITKLIRYLISENELQNPVDWKTVIQIIEVLKLNERDNQQWYEKYLTNLEQEKYNRYALTRTHEWLALYEEVKINLHTNPESAAGVELVQKWVALASESYGDQPELINKLWEAYKAGIIPSDLPNDKEVIAYLAKAFEKYQELMCG
jgi:hypothetical protein